MKTLIVFLLAICTYNGVYASQGLPIFVSNPSSGFVELPLKITICIDFGEVTACLTIEFKKPNSVINNNINVIGRLNGNSVVLSGFQKNEEGGTIIFTAKEPLIPSCPGVTSKYMILPGNYKIEKGSCIIKLSKK